MPARSPHGRQIALSFCTILVLTLGVVAVQMNYLQGMLVQMEQQ